MRWTMGVALLGLFVQACSACEEKVAPTAPAPASQPASEPASVPAALATVVAQRGKVEVQRKLGGWQEVKVGDRLDETDAVRTSEDAEIDIAVNQVKLRIHERSEFSVKKLSDSVIRGRLTGRMESQVAEGKGQVEVEANGSDTVVRTTGGHFSMISNGRGVVAVANIAGDVDVAAKGQSVRLTPGQVSHVRPNTAPESPSKALRSVLLAVEWPSAKVTNRQTISLTGSVEVGSRVLIQGRVVEPDERGHFVAQVDLKHGSQALAVVATDVLGRKKRAETTITHDNKAPHVRMRDKLWR